MGNLCNKKGGAEKESQDLENTGETTGAKKSEQQATKDVFVRVQDVKKFKERYQHRKPLGEGAFGKVDLFFDKELNKRVAVKTIKRSHVDDVDFVSETTLLKNLDHPNIIKIFDIYKDTKNFYLVFEMCEGPELFDYISEQRTLSETNAATIMYQIVSSVNYMHDNKIVHRDLKPENVMLVDKHDDKAGKKTMNIKIIDFGTSVKFQKNKKLTKMLGTPQQVAPEVLRQKQSFKCDIWSCGVILQILLSGCPPFFGQNDQEILHAVKHQDLAFDDPEWNEISAEAKDLIKKMLNRDEAKRFSAAQVLQHKWFKQWYKPENDLESNEGKMVFKGALDRMNKFTNQCKLQKTVFLWMASVMSRKEETTVLNDIFYKLDENGDGKLSREEMNHGYKDAFGANVPDEEVKQIVDDIFTKYDVDGSGFLEQTEFVAATMDRDKLMSDDSLRKAFEVQDTDKSGAIDAKELRSILGGETGFDDKVWNEIIKEVDKNGDGEIELSEFIAMMTDQSGVKK